MKCQRCQKREATIMIKQSTNNSEKEYKLCQDCLYELGLAKSFGFDLDNYLGSGAISQHVNSHLNPQNLTGTYNSGVFVPGKKETQICTHCNTTLDEVRKKGKLGCSHCYESFEEPLGQVFRRIQSGDRHRGRKIAESKEKNEIDLLHRHNEELQSKIKQAVEVEDYMSAAKWKSQILQNKEKIESLEKAKKDILEKEKSDIKKTPRQRKEKISEETTTIPKLNPKKKPGNGEKEG